MKKETYSITQEEFNMVRDVVDILDTLPKRLDIALKRINHEIGYLTCDMANISKKYKKALGDIKMEKSLQLQEVLMLTEVDDSKELSEVSVGNEGKEHGEDKVFLEKECPYIIEILDSNYRILSDNRANMVLGINPSDAIRKFVRGSVKGVDKITKGKRLHVIVEDNDIGLYSCMGYRFRVF